MPPNPNLPAFEKFGRTINPSEDPTKTAGLRARWVAQVRKRWAEVQAFVTQSVVAEDFFGLRRDTPPANPSQQIERFMAALVRVEGTTINEEKGGFIPWITPFVGEAFSKGMIRGNRDLAALARGQKREARTSTGNALRLVTNAAELFEAPTLDPNNIQDALQAGERARLFEMEVTRTWQGITGVTAQVNAQVAAAIADGLETRATPRQMAKDINARIDAVGVTRSQMIARTETVAANNRGAVAEFAEAQRLTGFEVHVQWETSLDSRVRDTHIVRHGDVYTKEAGLGLISEPNCLLPDAMVFSPSHLERVYKRRYNGRVITIKTASGNELTCTPNHPILTRSGMVAAGSLDVGGYVLCSLAADAAVPIAEDKDHIKASIEDVFGAFALHGEMTTAACRALHFHGDGTDGEVCVILSDGELEEGIEPFISEHVAKSPLHWLDVGLLLKYTLGPIRKVFDCALHAPNSIMRGVDLLASLAVRHASPFDPLRFALTSGCDPLLFQDEVNGAAPDANSFADDVDAVAFYEKAAHEAAVNPINGASDRREASNADAPLDDLVGDAQLGSEFLQGAAFGEVFADEIISVDVSVYDGHVYNLQCRVGSYIAQNIITGNCRCALLPYIPAIEGDVDLSSGKAAKALTPKAAEKPAAKERKKLDLPKGQVGKPIKRRKPKG